MTFSMSELNQPTKIEMEEEVRAQFPVVGISCPPPPSWFIQAMATCCANKKVQEMGKKLAIKGWFSLTGRGGGGVATSNKVWYGFCSMMTGTEQL
jgi:hypothetical protein